jgi:sulfoxide reductase heme-binding subunit YedZ
MRWFKITVFVLCLVPLALLGWKAYQQDLSANPIEYITHWTGDWTLRFILITLAITPLRKLLRWPDLVKFRRMLGLFAFFYGCLRFTTYAGWTNFSPGEIVKDIAKRRVIAAQFAAFIVPQPMAITSGRLIDAGRQALADAPPLIYFSAVMASCTIIGW